MRSHAGAPLGRRRFLALSAGRRHGRCGGAERLRAPGVTGVERLGRHRHGDGQGRTTSSPELIKQAQKDIGVKIVTVRYDPTKLNAMLASARPAGLVRGVGAGTPYFAARG